LIRLEQPRPQLDADTVERVLEHAADAGAMYTPGRPRPDPALLLQQYLREAGLGPAQGSK
jgi:hypothetical protein